VKTLFCFLFLSINIGCIKEDLSSNTKSMLTCTIGGTSFLTSLAGARVENTISIGTLQIVGYDDNGNAVELLLDDKTAISGKNVDAEGGVIFKGKNYAILPEKPGQVTISKRTKTNVSGTFSFNAVQDIINQTGSISVTNGKFDVTIE
jgi:hypothetical protein